MSTGFRVIIYRQTYNLGDAIQTLALSRLLGRSCHGVYRDDPLPSNAKHLPLIVNGWLGRRPPDPDAPAVFAGIHLARHHDAFAQWIANSPQPAGVRDSYTAGLLHGLAAVVMVGCATLTLEPYRGVRRGRYSIDVEPEANTTFLSQAIGLLSWEEQWALAMDRLEAIRRAEVVYTSRLHVVLPCLAFGTPVVFSRRHLSETIDRERLTILSEFPFVYDEPMALDVSVIAERFVRHLKRIAGPLDVQNRPKMPIPLT